jgi:hypothetical protein
MAMFKISTRQTWSTTTFIFVSFIPLLSSLHFHDPGIYLLDKSGEASRLARFQLKRNPFAIRSAELGSNSTYYPQNLCSSSEGCIVLGSQGSGKTALRISIENELSKERKSPFVISLTQPQQLDHFIFEFKSKFIQDSFVIAFLLILVSANAFIRAMVFFVQCIFCCLNRMIRTCRNQLYEASTQENVVVSIIRHPLCCGRPRILLIACLHVLSRDWSMMF